MEIIKIINVNVGYIRFLLNIFLMNSIMKKKGIKFGIKYVKGRIF